jgi:hypothetical protein
MHRHGSKIALYEQGNQYARMPLKWESWSGRNPPLLDHDHRLTNDPGPRRVLHPPGSAGIGEHEAWRYRVGTGSETNK